MELDLGCLGVGSGNENGDVVELELEPVVGEGMAMDGSNKETKKFPLNFRGLLCITLATEVG